MGSTVFRPDHGAGSKAVGTLRDAALYITKLPKAEHDAEEWQAAMQALLLVAELDGSTMFDAESGQSLLPTLLVIENRFAVFFVDASNEGEG